MAYGFYAENSFGETVIDTETPVYQLFSGGVQSGFYNSTYNLYEYPADNASFVFFNLSVGDWAGKTHTGTFISNRNTLGIRSLRIAPQITPSSNYGLRLFDASGNITYSSDAEIESIEGSYRIGGGYLETSLTSFPTTLPFDATYSRNETADWFALNASAFTTLSNYYACSVIFKETSTYIHHVLKRYATAPNSVLNPEGVSYTAAS